MAMRFPRFAFVVTVTLTVAAAGGGSVTACGGRAPEAKNVLTHAPETWCPEGFEQGPQDTCFALPEEHTKTTPVVIYLHGMFKEHGSPEEWAAVREATRRGFAVVVPRGRRGLCAWKAELHDHFCWPQEPDDPPTMRAMIADWERVLWQVDALLEGGAHKRYILGYSNGGFFGSYVATHGLFPAQAFAVVNGGPLAPPATKTKPAPMLLLSAAEDKAQSGTMKDLHEQLAKAGWAHAYCARGGSHALAADDVDAALRFFKRDADGSLHAQGGSYACEGGTSPAVSGGDAPSKSESRK